MVNKIEHNFRTDEEYYFACYLDELIKKKYVKKYLYEPYSMEITEGLKIPYTKIIKLKTKTKIESKEQIVLRGSSYTPDFVIYWTPLAKEVFYNLLFTGKQISTPFIANNDGNTDYSIVECKPAFDSGNMTRLFINNQKIIWDKYEKFVNLIKNDELFEKSFVPSAYTNTATGRKKKINYKVKTLQQFLKQKK